MQEASQRRRPRVKCHQMIQPGETADILVEPRRSPVPVSFPVAADEHIGVREVVREFSARTLNNVSDRFDKVRPEFKVVREHDLLVAENVELDRSLGSSGQSRRARDRRTNNFFAI